jgi:DNA-binding NarL/FixJ family response regulator
VLDGGGAAGASSAGPVRIVIADSRRLISDAIAALIGRNPRFMVAASVVDAEAIAAVAAQNPDVLVFGFGDDFHEAMDQIRTVRARFANLEIVILADSLAPELISLVLNYGVGGVVLTDCDVDEIAACIAQVAGGRAVLPTGWKRAITAERDDPLVTLSKRQMEVLQLLAQGCSNEEIGTRLFISLNTVKFHVRSIFSRLGVHNRIAAARILDRRR